MGSDILHVDLDAFYASVARRADPRLEGIPLIVGGDGNRGVVLSCSYEARAKGVRNGMPSVRARRLCPGAVFVPPDFGAYPVASEAFRGILDEVTPSVEPMSLDEAFCDVSGAHRLYGTSEKIAEHIRGRVQAELGLTCSVGGGPTKLVAKLASRACKPDGVFIVDDSDAFLRPLPIAELWGIGETTAAVLRRIGIATVGDLASAPEAVLRHALGDNAGPALRRLAAGIDPRPVTASARAKSVGAEETFGHDLDATERIHAEILRLSDRVASRLVAQQITGRTVTLKIRLQDFATHTRSQTLKTPTNDVWTINRCAREAYDAFARGRRRVRLLGVSVSGLVEGRGPEQLSFEPRPRFAEAEEALARVRERFGDDAMGLARLLDLPPDR